MRSFTMSPTTLKPAGPTRSLVAPARRARTTRSFTVQAMKVTVLGAAGGIGQPLSLLLKLNSSIDELALYDIANTPGVAADLSHCNTSPQVSGYMGADQLEEALTGADLVVIPAGVPRKPGMTRDDLFNINAGIVKSLSEGCAQYCPKAVIEIISNPVNSTVPICSEVMKAAGVYDPKKIIGVTTLDVVRSSTFLAAHEGLNVADVNVPVVGGHAGITIMPLLSQSTPSVDLSQEQIEALSDKIQNAGTEVVEAKAGTGSATLSMAFAAARMAESTIKALNGESDVVECAYVASDVTDLPYFASQCLLGPNGVEEVMPLGEITEYEQKCVDTLCETLGGNISKGTDFVTQA